MTLKHSDISIVADVLNSAQIEACSKEFDDFIYFLELIMIKRTGLKPTKIESKESNIIKGCVSIRIYHKLSNDKLHREDGPASYWKNAEEGGFYYLNNRRLTKDAFEKYIDYINTNI